MKPLHQLISLRKHPFVILTPVTLLVVGSLSLPSSLKAGTGGTYGGCAFAHQVNGATVYAACSGANSPMYYPVSANPTYGIGDFACGYFGNQKCGMETGDPLNE